MKPVVLPSHPVVAGDFAPDDAPSSASAPPLNAVDRAIESRQSMPYIDRRRENGWGLYGLLGITKGDKDKMHAQHQRNYRFFDAPVGLMFTLDRVMGRGSLLDYGMFMENFMIGARGHGLHTCPQAAWNGFSKIILPHIGAGDSEMLVCGIALGYADESARVNTFRTPRVSAAEFTTWLE